MKLSALIYTIRSWKSEIQSISKNEKGFGQQREQFNEQSSRLIEFIVIHLIVFYSQLIN